MKKKYLNLEFCHDLSAPDMKNCGMHHKSNRDCLTFHQNKENRSWSGFMVKWKLCVLFSHFSCGLLKGELVRATLGNLDLPISPPWGSVGSWYFFACQGDRKVAFYVFFGLQPYGSFLVQDMDHMDIFRVCCLNKLSPSFLHHCSLEIEMR